MSVNSWPHKGWHHADKKLSARATKLLGRQCYVCPGYLDDTGEDAYMIADGIHTPVCISTLDELPAGVAELKSGISDAPQWR